MSTFGGGFPKNEAMTEPKDIDLQKLSQRELLILTCEKVKDMGEVLKNLSGNQEKHEVRLSIIETKVKIWAALIGGAAALAIEIITSIVK